jgi:hypothetical protein
MKKILIIGGLLTVFAAPALAQGDSSSYGTGNIQPFAYDSQGVAHQMIPPNEAQGFGTRPLFNYVSPQQQGKHKHKTSS